MRTLQCFFPAFAQDLCRSTILDAKLQSSDRYVVETFFSRVKEFLLVCALSATDLYAPLAARVLGRLCCRPSPRSWREHYLKNDLKYKQSGATGTLLRTNIISKTT
jgi:hypothetical protein